MQRNISNRTWTRDKLDRAFSWNIYHLCKKTTACAWAIEIDKYKRYIDEDGYLYVSDWKGEIWRRK